jgi:bacterial/archaeal transporter family-2 protein
VSWTGAAVAVALGAGIAGSVQVAVMGRFGDRVGTLEALAFTTVLGALIATVALLVARRSLDGYATAYGAPKWLWLGAALGVFVVGAITVAGPRIGTTATVALLIAGQLGAALAIDRLGWFGVEKVGVTWLRAVGVVLLVAGAALTLRR